MSDQAVPPERYPWWVKLSLLGAHSRQTMENYSIASIVIGVVLAVAGVAFDDLFLVLLGIIGGPLSALAYTLTIRWIDSHGSWDVVSRR